MGDRDFLNRHWRGLLICAVVALLFVAPQAVTYANNPRSALDRTSGVFVLQPDNLAHELDAYKVNSVSGVLLQQFVNSIDAFNLRGETSMQYAQRAPLLDFWSGALFVLGVVFVTIRAGRPRYSLLASWFWLTLLLGSVFTIDALFAPRMISVLAVTPILPALIVDGVWRGLSDRFGSTGSSAAAVIAVAFLLVAAWANYVAYFDVHVKTMEPANFFTVLSRYLETVNDRYRVYLLADRDTSLRYDTAHFLIPNVDGVDVRDSPLPMPLDRIPDRKGVVFVDPSATDPRFLRIKAQYPRGVLGEHRSNNGAIQFYSYRVERSDLEAANPRAHVDHAPIPATDLNKVPPAR